MTRKNRASRLAAILLTGTTELPTTNFIDFTATLNEPFLKHQALTLEADGDAVFSGTLSAATGSFAGSLSAATGTFAGDLQAASGTFAGSLSAAGGTFTGTLSGVDGDFSGEVKSSSFTATTANFKDIVMDHGGGANPHLRMNDINGNRQLDLHVITSRGRLALQSGDANGALQLILAGGVSTPTEHWAVWAQSQDTVVEKLGGLNVGVKLKVNSVGSIQLPDLPTTGSAANAHFAAANDNQLLRSTSSSRYKTDIRALTPVESRALVEGLVPVVYRSLSPADDPTQEFIGFTAESVAALDPRLVHYLGGEPDGVMYDRLIAPLAKVVQDHEQWRSDVTAALAAASTFAEFKAALAAAG